MKKLSLCFFAFLIAFAPVVGAVDVNNGINDKIIVDGSPAITGEAVDAQLRLLEFVLATRLTVGQKYGFLRAIKSEAKQMDSEERTDFLESVSLVDSLNQLDVENQEEIRDMLKKEFDESSVESKGDPAADLYMSVLNEATSTVVKNKEFNVTKQAVFAFAEYIAFISNPDNPKWFNGKAIELIESRVKVCFSSLNEEEKETLENFHYAWYLIRAAWQNADASTRSKWLNNFKKLGLVSGNIPGVKDIKPALSVEIYGDLLDSATMSNIEPIEWSVGTKVKVW